MWFREITTGIGVELRGRLAGVLARAGLLAVLPILHAGFLGFLPLLVRLFLSLPDQSYPRNVKFKILRCSNGPPPRANMLQFECNKNKSSDTYAYLHEGDA